MSSALTFCTLFPGSNSVARPCSHCLCTCSSCGPNCQCHKPSSRACQPRRRPRSSGGQDSTFTGIPRPCPVPMDHELSEKSSSTSSHLRMHRLWRSSDSCVKMPLGSITPGRDSPTMPTFMTGVGSSPVVTSTTGLPMVTSRWHEPRYGSTRQRSNDTKQRRG